MCCRAPVRATVRENWPDIVAARREGVSLKAIYRVMHADGKTVGAGPSSFIGAVRYWDNQGASEVAAPAVSDQPTPAPAPPAVNDSTRPVSGFADRRYPTNF